MRKLLLSILMTILVCNLSAQRLDRGMWQLQNPTPMSVSSILSFSNGSCKSCMMDMITGQIREARGTYTTSGNNLTILMNGYRYVYVLKWHNTNKVGLMTNQGTLVYSQANTTEDQYMNNFLYWCNVNGVSSSGSVNNGGSNSGSKTCYTCRGVGNCKVCRGSGVTSNPYTGTRSVCSACNGTGKCWHCHGSGIQ